MFRENEVVRFAMVALALSGLPTAASAQDAFHSAPSPHICILPLLPASQELLDKLTPSTLKLNGLPEVLPGMPSPILALKGYPGRWLINPDRRLVPYNGFWPVQSYLDHGHQAREPWSLRTVAITYGGGVSVLPKGADRFERIDGSLQVADHHGGFSRPFILPHRKETVVAASDGSPYLVQDERLVPWLTSQEMSQRGVALIASIHESRFLGGDVILDKNGRLHILTDDGTWHEIITLGRGDWGDVADAPQSGVSIFLGQYHAAIIAPSDGGEYRGWIVASNYRSWAGNDFYVSKLFGEAFYFGYSGFFDLSNRRWLRVRPNGFEEVEGSSRVVLSGVALLDSFRSASVHDLASIHRILFQGRDGFFLYDGASIVPLPNSGPDVVGAYPRVVDLPSLGVALVEGKGDIWEVTLDGRLKKIAAPPGVLDLKEWPQAHVALGLRLITNS